MRLSGVAIVDCSLFSSVVSLLERTGSLLAVEADEKHFRVSWCLSEASPTYLPIRMFCLALRMKI